jgi:hypothetical protein
MYKFVMLYTADEKNFQKQAAAFQQVIKGVDAHILKDNSGAFVIDEGSRIEVFTCSGDLAVEIIVQARGKKKGFEFVSSERVINQKVR